MALKLKARIEQESSNTELVSLSHSVLLALNSQRLRLRRSHKHNLNRVYCVYCSKSFIVFMVKQQLPTSKLLFHLSLVAARQPSLSFSFWRTTHESTVKRRERGEASGDVRVANTLFTAQIGSSSSS